MRLPDGVDDREVAGAALERNIVDRPLSGYYADPLRTSAGLLLGYACVPDGEIAPAFDTLTDTIDAQLLHLS
jgi:GntR family transcriptional regulator/MocR family aminotransferase